MNNQNNAMSGVSNGNRITADPDEPVAGPCTQAVVGPNTPVVGPGKESAAGRPHIQYAGPDNQQEMGLGCDNRVGLKGLLERVCNGLHKTSLAVGPVVNKSGMWNPTHHC
nr:hypothetical protein [Tanacetum cinerariifolium]